MSGHTPGPWFYDECSEFGFVIRQEGGLRTVVASDNCEGINGPIPVEADARLMAAAPDLLAVLKDAGRALCADTSESSLGQRIRAAVAKATGEQP